MNTGRFFRLNQSLSVVVDGTTIYDYTELAAYPGLAEDNVMSPKYPINLVITSDSVRIRMHYCAYKTKWEEKDENGKTVIKDDYQYAIEDVFRDKGDNNNLAHVNEVILELPFVEKQTRDLTDIVKSAYIANFPQVSAEKGVMTGSRFIDKLIEEWSDGEKSKNPSISYSMLWLMDLYKNNSFDLYDDTKKGSKQVTKFLRKLLLDFMFDLKHSNVFCNSPNYDRMYNGLMSNYYFSALMHKCEFFYYRDLTIHAIEKPNGDKDINDQITRLYAQELFAAEEKWAADIRNPLADKYFEQKFPNDFENRRWLYGRHWTELCSHLGERMTRTRWDSWFANPEEEMRRIYFKMMENGSRTICNTSVLVEHLGMDKSEDETVKAMTLSARQNRGNTSRWFLNRYDFNDVLHLHLFKCSNGIFLFLAFILLWCLFEIPIPFVEKQPEMGLEGLLSFTKGIRKFLLEDYRRYSLGALGLLLFLDMRFIIKGYLFPKVLKPINWSSIKWNSGIWGKLRWNNLLIENPAIKKPLLKSFRRFRAKRVILVLWAMVCLLLFFYNLLESRNFLDWLKPLAGIFCWIFLTVQFIKSQRHRVFSIGLLLLVVAIYCFFNYKVLCTWSPNVNALMILLALAGLFLFLNARLLYFIRKTTRSKWLFPRLEKYFPMVAKFFKKGKAYHSKHLGVLRTPYIHPIESWHLLLPKLVASITAAWLTIAMGFDALAAFFDSAVVWSTMMIIIIVVFSFILYQIDRELPESSSWLKVYRTIELLIISYCLSLCVGVVIINFVGERYLERSGAVDDYYDEYVYEHGQAPVIVKWNFKDTLIAVQENSLYDLPAPKSSRGKLNLLKYDFTKWKLVNDTIILLPHQIKAQSGQFLYWKGDTLLSFPSAIIQKYTPDEYRHVFASKKIVYSKRDLFIIPDFLIMFSFVAMFIGVFLQMVFFDRKKMTEF